MHLVKQTAREFTLGGREYGYTLYVKATLNSQQMTSAEYLLILMQIAYSQIETQFQRLQESKIQEINQSFTYEQ